MKSPDEEQQKPVGIQRVRSGGPTVQHIDPVCGMPVASEGDIGSVEVDDTRFLFCAKRCRDRFRQNPTLFLDPVKRSSLSAEGSIYICPMDPEVREMEPVPCRICGMALEPAIPTINHAPDPEYLDLSRRFRYSFALTLPLLVVAMTEMSGLLHSLPFSAMFIYWVQFLLATPVVFWGGRPLLSRGITSIRHLSPNMFTLIALGVSVAHFFSVTVLLFPENSIWRELAGSNHGLPVFFEASAVIVTLALLGQLLESKARRKTGDSVRELLGLRSEDARVVLGNGDEVVVPVTDLEIGAVLSVSANQRIPIDGVVTEGKSSVDESMITGESVPVVKEAGDELFGGTINGNSNLLMTVTRVGEETLISRIVAMVSEAQRTKAPVQRLADNVSRIFVPAVVVISALSLLIWTLNGNAIFGIVTAVSVLIIACPCALGLATPISIMVGSGVGARNGILLKSGEAIQNLAETAVIAFDKTGTLTLGRPKVVEIRAGVSFSEDEVLRYAASAERHSEHPLANSILDEAASRNLDLAQVANFVSKTSMGVSGIIDGRSVFVGRPEDPEEFILDSRSAIEVRVDGQRAGIIFVEDPVCGSASVLLRELDELGMRSVMLTGDSDGVARNIAERLKIPEYRAGLLPGDKSRIISELKSKGDKVTMVGDGVNDAPALATADVGIALGSGAAAAIETSDVTLLSGRVSDVRRAISLSRDVMRNIKQNLFFAFAYNIIGIPIAAGILYPWLGLLLSPMIASLAMTFSSVSVIANALRLRNSRF